MATGGGEPAAGGEDAGPNDAAIVDCVSHSEDDVRSDATDIPGARDPLPQKSASAIRRVQGLESMRLVSGNGERVRTRVEAEMSVRVDEARESEGAGAFVNLIGASFQASADLCEATFAYAHV